MFIVLVMLIFSGVFSQKTFEDGIFIGIVKIGLVLFSGIITANILILERLKKEKKQTSNNKIENN